MKKNNHQLAKNLGFNLLELMIALALAAILAVVATASFSYTSTKLAVRSSVDDIVNLMRFAVGEAYRQNLKMLVCPALVNSKSILTGCLNKNDWSQGLLLYGDYSADERYAGINRLKFINLQAQAKKNIKISLITNINAQSPNLIRVFSNHTLNDNIFSADAQNAAPLVFNVSGDNYYACVQFNNYGINTNNCFKGDDNCPVGCKF